MKTILLLTLALALAGCDKPTASNEPAPAPAATAPVPAPAKPAPPIAPVAAAAVAPVAPERVRELAPADVFFLTQSVSVETDSGIARLLPGQRLALVKPGTYTADGRQFTLRDDQVTNDLALARQYASLDARAQAALHGSLKRAADTADAAKAAAQAIPPSAPSASAPTATPFAPRPNALNSKAYGATKAFVDTDGDGKKFDTQQKSRK